MLVSSKFAVCYLGKRFNDLLADVLLADIAVEVDKDFEEHHGVLAEFVKYRQDKVLVMIARVARV